jgi:vancomycin resistance protein VanJ
LSGTPSAVRWATALTAAGLVWLLLLVLLEFLVAERNSLAAAVMYAPQHLFALPLVAGLLAAAWARKWALLAVNASLIVCFLWLFMGFHCSVGSGRSGDIRAMTINLARSAYPPEPLLTTIGREKPDIILFQEAKAQNPSRTALTALSSAGGWHVEKAAEVAIASRSPLRNIREVVLLPGSGRRMLIADTDIRGHRTAVAVVHFGTNMPGRSKGGLWGYLAGSGEARMRQVDSLLASLPNDNIILGGDFNLPPRGLAYRKLSRRYTNAFQAATGFGYTFPARHPLMRIDHIFTGRGLAPVSCRAVDTGASDHKAVIADFALE